MAQLPSLEHDTEYTAASSPVLSAARPGTGIASFQEPLVCVATNPWRPEPSR